MGPNDQILNDHKFDMSFIDIILSSIADLARQGAEMGNEMPIVVLVDLIGNYIPRICLNVDQINHREIPLRIEEVPM